MITTMEHPLMDRHGWLVIVGSVPSVVVHGSTFLKICAAEAVVTKPEIGGASVPSS
jgi:hypothetical protein